MIQNLAFFGTFAAAAVCVAYAIFMFTQSEEEPQTHRPNRNPAPSPRRQNTEDPLRRRNKSSSSYRRMIEVIESIYERTLECPICKELIRARERAWFCRSCSVGHHLTCATQWAQSQRELGTSDFSCPSCRHIGRPPQNTCMCGRSSHPNINYSCGSTCQECALECHPGPCQLV